MNYYDNNLTFFIKPTGSFPFQRVLICFTILSSHLLGPVEMTFPAKEVNTSIVVNMLNSSETGAMFSLE